MPKFELTFELTAKTSKGTESVNPSLIQIESALYINMFYGLTR